MFDYYERSVVRDFLIAFTVTAVVAVICYPVVGAIGYQTVGLIFLMTVALLSLFLGRAALIFTAILIFCVWNFFFIQPLYTFRVHSFHDLIALFTNLIVALAAGTLISRIRKSQVVLQKSQERLTILHGFLESLNDAVSIKDVVRRAEEGMKNNFDARMIIFLRNKKGTGLSMRPFGNEKMNNEAIFKVAEKSYADPSSDAVQITGGEKIFFYSLKEPRTSIGVIGIAFPGGILPPEEKQVLLKSFIAQIASALDREISIDLAKEKEISTESEKLFQTVLNSVSHELKTPISIISAAVANLNDVRTSSEPLLRKQIGEELEIASARMNHLVENILDMSRLDSGLLKLNMQVCDIADLIGVAVNDLGKSDHIVKIDVEESMPFIRADIILLRQALINILHNALIYTPAGSEIRVDAFLFNEEEICIRVTDNGPGVPAGSLPHLFEKFYRVPGTRSGGTGLGLAIAKTISELHGGRVVAENKQGRGFSLSLILKINDRQSEV